MASSSLNQDGIKHNETESGEIDRELFQGSTEDIQHGQNTDIEPDLQEKNEAHSKVEKGLGIPKVKCVHHNVQKSDVVVHSWDCLVRSFGLEKYFYENLGLQDILSLHGTQIEGLEKHNLPWRVLEKVILLNSECREVVISSFAEKVQPKTKNKKRTFGQPKVKTEKQDPETRTDGIPHPMDMMLLLFTCSDYMLRQVLAQKLFICRLAIPFIVPTPEGTVQMLLWPLRSIVMEWRNEKQEAMEESFVMCQMNMITFMRYGASKFSKSKLLNDILSSSGHSTFFHKGAPCGNEKRQISDGTVEMSHFLPAGKQQDKFKQPALFFNLRGDACNHPVQHDLLLDFATTLIIVIDISELDLRPVQENLKETVRKKQSGVIVILTDHR